MQNLHGWKSVSQFHSISLLNADNEHRFQSANFGRHLGKSAFSLNWSTGHNRFRTCWRPNTEIRLSSMAQRPCLSSWKRQCRMSRNSKWEDRGLEGAPRRLRRSSCTREGWGGSWQLLARESSGHMQKGATWSIKWKIVSISRNPIYLLSLVW